MPSRRTIALLITALGLWGLAILLGSPTVHAVAFGLMVLPLVAHLIARRSAPRITAHRRMAEQRVTPGQRVEVVLELENRSRHPVPFLLVEDIAPDAIGGPARAVLAGLDGHGLRRVSYAFTPQRRGRYPIGPLRLEVADPFGLQPTRVTIDDRVDIVVTPPVEDLRGVSGSPFGATSGLALARHRFRGGGDFYLMRAYREGDDLRRIHWPSVARRGELMIRQDESSTRARALLYLDTRAGVAGRAGGPVFEHLVGIAASIGTLFVTGGFSTQMATGLLAPQPVSEDSLLDALAAVGPDGAALAPSLARLRGVATSDTVLVLVAAVPDAGDLAALSRTGTLFGPKVAALVPEDDDADARTDAAYHSLSRAGWRVLLVPPTVTLRERWNADTTTRRAGYSS